jgi:hypothetical protein
MVLYAGGAGNGEVRTEPKKKRKSHTDLTRNALASRLIISFAVDLFCAMKEAAEAGDDGMERVAGSLKIIAATLPDREKTVLTKIFDILANDRLMEVDENPSWIVDLLSALAEDSEGLIFSSEQKADLIQQRSRGQASDGAIGEQTPANSPQHRSTFIENVVLAITNDLIDLREDLKVVSSVHNDANVNIGRDLTLTGIFKRNSYCIRRLGRPLLWERRSICFMTPQ